MSPKPRFHSRVIQSRARVEAAGITLVVDRTYKRDSDGKFASSGSEGDSDANGNTFTGGAWHDEDGTRLTDGYVATYGKPVTYVGFGYSASGQVSVVLSEEGTFHIARDRTQGGAGVRDAADVRVSGLTADGVRSLATDIRWARAATTTATGDSDEETGAGSTRTNAATGLVVTAGRGGSVTIGGLGKAGGDLRLSEGAAGDAADDLGALADAHADHFGATNRAGARGRMRARIFRRDGRGRFSTSGGGVRPSLAGAGSAMEVGRAAEVEARRITGRSIPFDLGNADVEVAQQHAEGVLRGLEAFPRAQLARVGTYPAGGEHPAVAESYALTRVLPTGFEITFNEKYATNPTLYAEKIARGGTDHVVDPTMMGTALHEVGHVVTANPRSLWEPPLVPAARLAVRMAAAEGRATGPYVHDQVSRYAATSPHELAAEAFNDVMAHGAGAAPLSQAIYAEIEALHGPSNTVTAVVDRVYKRDDAGKFSSGGGGGNPAEMHGEAVIRQTYDFDDPATGMSARVSGISVGVGGQKYVNIEIRDRDGEVVGEAVRTIRPADRVPPTVEHSGMGFEPGMQGQGFATRYNEQVEASYRAHGIERITLNANIDVGGYAWARAGFDFANSVARSTVLVHLAIQVERYGPEVRAEVNRHIRENKASPIELAMIGWTPGAKTWPGKEMMLGSMWDGVKDLTAGPSALAVVVVNHPGHADQKSHGRRGMASKTRLKEAYERVDEQTGLRTRIASISTDEEHDYSLHSHEGWTKVEVVIENRDGEGVGYAIFHISTDGKTVYHDEMRLDDGMQGQGFATRQMVHVVDAYRRNGVQTLELEANLDVGGYAWARAGFDFANPESRTEVADFFWQAQSQAAYRGVQGDIERVAGNPNSSPADFALIGHAPGVDMWPGKEIMLGVAWDAKMDL